MRDSILLCYVLLFKEESRLRPLYPLFFSFPRFGAQRIFLDFSRARFREFAEGHAGGAFEVGDMFAAESDNFFICRRLIFF